MRDPRLGPTSSNYGCVLLMFIFFVMLVVMPLVALIEKFFG